MVDKFMSVRLLAFTFLVLLKWKIVESTNSATPDTFELDFSLTKNDPKFGFLQINEVTEPNIMGYKCFAISFLKPLKVTKYTFRGEEQTGLPTDKQLAGVLTYYKEDRLKDLPVTISPIASPDDLSLDFYLKDETGVWLNFTNLTFSALLNPSSPSSLSLLSVFENYYKNYASSTHTPVNKTDNLELYNSEVDPEFKDLSQAVKNLRVKAFTENCIKLRIPAGKFFRSLEHKTDVEKRFEELKEKYDSFSEDERSKVKDEYERVVFEFTIFKLNHLSSNKQDEYQTGANLVKSRANGKMILLSNNWIIAAFVCSVLLVLAMVSYFIFKSLR